MTHLLEVTDIMENKYSLQQINDIREHVKIHGYAKNYIEPTFFLVSTISMMFGVLYFIDIQKSYNPILILLLSFIILRLFMIFHDLGHKSYFPTDEREKGYKGFNIQIAKCIEQWCLYSTDIWSDGHALHHKAHGNMNEYDYSRTTLSTTEYDNLTSNQKILYKIGRNPVVFFLLAPIYIFWIKRFINGEWVYLLKYSIWLFTLFRPFRIEYAESNRSNPFIYAPSSEAEGGILNENWCIISSWKLLFSFLIAQYIAGIIGTMLFHLQHQVNIGYLKEFDINDILSKYNAELSGASVLKIPFFLEFFTNGIEYHNVHHIDPGIPSYNTKMIYYQLVEKGLIPDTKIGYLQELSSLCHTIFNEKTQLYE